MALSLCTDVSSNEGLRRTLLKKPLAIQEHGYRAIVFQGHQHVGLEPAGGHLQAPGGQGGNELAVKVKGLLRRGRGGETGPPALATVAVEGKLGNCQDFPAGVPDGQVHFTILVGKDPQAGDFIGQVLHVGRAVLLPHPQEDEQTGTDCRNLFPGYRNPGLFDTLDYRPHGRPPLLQFNTNTPRLL
ncbi:hypothetical protein MTY_0136 [Moorella thermoacetica Y72]|uniref:Uncharacterized protein n=1 Tax=Moorella thermoacetica Y72 TaxID=1325331 RepID=A0A0S6UA73_NEOTH|nr:hypothetical protein MTY_0136 [Moorella thermoacetica Y72]